MLYNINYIDIRVVVSLVNRENCKHQVIKAIKHTTFLWMVNRSRCISLLKYLDLGSQGPSTSHTWPDWESTLKACMAVNVRAQNVSQRYTPSMEQSPVQPLFCAVEYKLHFLLYCQPLEVKGVTIMAKLYKLMVRRRTSNTPTDPYHAWYMVHNAKIPEPSLNLTLLCTPLCTDLI